MAVMKTILWDFDGTLGHRRGGWTDALLTVVQRHVPGRIVLAEELRSCLANGFFWHTPEHPHRHITSAQQWWDHLLPVFARAFSSVGLPAAIHADLASEVREEYLEPGSVMLFEDSLPVLRQLSEHGWRHAMLSNHVPEFHQILAEVGLAETFVHVANSAWTGYEKPHPQAFRGAMAALGDPREAWMIGDNMVADVQGAEAAGLKAILVRKPHRQARYFASNLWAAAAIIDKASGQTV